MASRGRRWIDVVAIGGTAPGRLLAQELVDTRDRLVDRPLGRDALGRDAVNRLRPDALCLNQLMPPLARSYRVAVATRLAQELDSRRHSMRVAWVEPERLLEQRRQRRQVAVPSEVEPVRQPALAHQEAHELLGHLLVPASLDHRDLGGLCEDGQGLAVVA